jgi:hypothetical protein
MTNSLTVVGPSIWEKKCYRFDHRDRGKRSLKAVVSRNIKRDHLRDEEFLLKKEPLQQ